MKTPSSLRQLLRGLHRASGAPPSWLMLYPESRVHQSNWHYESDNFICPADPAELVRIAAQIPQGGHVSTAHAPWVARLVQALLGPRAKGEDQVILPFHKGSKLVACVGWTDENQALKNLVHQSAVRRTFQEAWALEITRSECHALRWVLKSCDRLTAAVRPNGEILASSPAASDLLKSLQVGPCHYFHTSEPELPTTLVRAITNSPVGQAKLSKDCTARFDPIKLPPTSWLPLIGIELLAEKGPKAVRLPLPTSLLTPVERQVYDLIKLAKSNREISEIRGTAFATTKNQVSTVLSKLGVSRRHHLLLYEDTIMNLSAQPDKPGMNGVTSSTR